MVLNENIDSFLCIYVLFYLTGSIMFYCMDPDYYNPNVHWPLGGMEEILNHILVTVFNISREIAFRSK